MVKLGFSLQQQYSLPTETIIALLAEYGFSAVSPIWSPELDLAQLSACCHSHGMTIQSVHAPRQSPACLWQPGSAAAKSLYENILQCISDCAHFQIPIMVLHGWQGLDYVFPDTPLDFSLFDGLVDCAEAKNIFIAFENLEGEEYLLALMTRYQARPYVGFCWDAGHDHCYPHKLNFLESFGQRLIMTHLHDNKGLRRPDGIPAAKDDLHFLPYDGTIAWDAELQRLKGLPQQQILNFELKTRAASTAPEDLLYDALSPEEFIRLAGQRARKIADLYDALSDIQKA